MGISTTTRANWAELIDWELSKTSDIPLYQQISAQIRDNILNGRIPAGSRLPSSRQLVVDLAVSRTTVIAAFSQLLTDGYIVGQIGSGTYVSTEAIDRPVDAAFVPPPRPDDISASALSMEMVHSYEDVDLAMLVQENVPFNTGVVRVDSRTSAQWQQLMRQNLPLEQSLFGYLDPAGDLELRQEIAKYLGAARAINCCAEHIVLISGTQQGLDLTIKTVLGPERSVWIEDPCYPLARLAFAAAGTKLCPVPVDHDGLRVEDGIASFPIASAAYVTPSHQYPLGVTLSMPRRVRLLDWAARVGSWIIEDDYDAEFRYLGPLKPALKALDKAERVIYLSSFSKVLFPGLRCGYAVVPPALVPAFKAARLLSDRHQPPLYQVTLTQLMKRGFFLSHIKRTREEYRRTRDQLVEMLRSRLGHLLEVETPNQGMHLIVYLKGDVSDAQIAQDLKAKGVVVRPLSRLHILARPRPGLMLGFTGFNLHKMRQAVITMGSVLERHLDARSTPLQGGLGAATVGASERRMVTSCRADVPEER